MTSIVELIKVEDEDNRTYYINPSHITWIDTEDREVCFYGTAQILVTKDSIEKLADYITTQSVPSTKLPLPNKTRKLGKS